MSRRHVDTSPLGRLCQAVGHPTRLRILRELSERSHTVSELVRKLDLDQPAVSKHLATLLKAGLVHYNAEGRCRCYALQHGDTLKRLISSFDMVCHELGNTQPLSGASEYRP